MIAVDQAVETTNVFWTLLTVIGVSYVGQWVYGRFVARKPEHMQGGRR